MSPAKKYTKDSLRLASTDRNTAVELENESLHIGSGYHPLQVIHNSHTTPIEVYNDWMSFSSNYINGMYNKI
ncbi:hypothetical protein ACFQO1_05510 [Jejudonia soesokkakensis]|uniref:Uncharacterized protein n=1 Tax=Jejudonia soesokkakensis TaxID=1323432 RepID=A0ABW2MSR2_9FLAO